MALTAASDLSNLRVKLVHDAHGGETHGAVWLAALTCEVEYLPPLAATPTIPGNSHFDFCRPRRRALELVSSFDLAYNTPPLYPWRASLLDSGGALYLRVAGDPRPDNRQGISGLDDRTDKGDPLLFRAYYTARRLTDVSSNLTVEPLQSLYYRAELSNTPQRKGFRPKLSRIELEIA